MTTGRVTAPDQRVTPRLADPALLRSIRLVRTALDRVGLALGDLAGWLFVLAALLVTFDVFSRKFLGFSTEGTTELTGFLLAIGITLGLAYALKEKTHVRVEMLVMKMPLGVRVYLHAFSLALLAFMAALFAWRSWDLVQESWLFRATDVSALHTPLIYPQSLFALGLTVFALLSVVMLAEVVVLIALGRREEVERLIGPRTVEEDTAEALAAAGLTDAEVHATRSQAAER